MSRKIYAGIIVYNNADYLRATLESLKSVVDGIIIVDGRYQTYPAFNNADNSTDGTLEIIRHFMYENKDNYNLAINFIHTPSPTWKTQVEKRNAYLASIPVGSWVFVIDGDEAVICRDPVAFRKELAEYEEKGKALVRITNYSDRFRFFIKKKNMKYEGYHWKVLDPETGHNVNDLVDAAQHIYGKPIKTLELAHFKWGRNERVLTDKKQFYEARKLVEDPHIMLDMFEKAKKLKEEGLLDEYLTASNK